MDDELLEALQSAEVDCPECELMEDDQYQCGTCGCGGGNGRINVFNFLKEHKNLLDE